MTLHSTLAWAELTLKGKVARTPEVLVPAGYAIRESAKGDLNGDGRDDVALVLEPDEASRTKFDEDGDPESDDGPRMLVVAIRTAGAYRVVSAREGAVLCRKCGIDTNLLTGRAVKPARADNCDVDRSGSQRTRTKVKKAPLARMRDVKIGE